MRRIAAALTLTALVLAGCGGDDDEPTASSDVSEALTDSSGSPADAPSGACPFVGPAPLDEAFATSFEETYGNEDGCSFIDPDGLSVLVTRIDIAIDPEQYAEESTSSCEDGSVVEVDAGDSAFACIAIGPSATVFHGDQAINLGVLAADDEDAAVDALAAALPSVTVAG